MNSITTKDGIQIYYKDWGRDSQSFSTTAGRCRPTIGMRR